MFDPASHPAFSAVQDPVSGTVSWHLDGAIAPVQRNLYYTNPSISGDGRWLWFAVAFPPNPQIFLARIGLDPAEPTPRWFPQAAFEDNSAAVAPSGDAAWFCTDGAVWRIDAEGRVERLGGLPADLVGGRRVFSTATHLTVSADGRHLALDSRIGDTSVLSTLDLGDGTVRVLHEFQEHHNHAQFSRHDPDLLLIAKDHYRNPITGRSIHHLVRTHVVRRDGSGYRCINPGFPCRPYHGACHEWWLADGQIAFIDYDTGVWAHDLATGVDTHLWREPLCHAHADAAGRFWCADQSPYFWDRAPCQVLLYDHTTGGRWRIHAGLPALNVPRGPWHLDPHPQFSPCGRFVVWMSTARGRPEVAITPISQFAHSQFGHGPSVDSTGAGPSFPPA
ncbi:hypothetical protein LBMAG53_25570 [Planctomycetota bacterium]|nr:hypothetical protein LBMAG53_25570 [Planctomycetota bacterium]